MAEALFVLQLEYGKSGTVIGPGAGVLSGAEA